MSLGIVAFTGSLVVALIAIGVGVGALLLLDIVSTTVIQRQVPDEMRGRAMGLIQLTGVTAALLGSLVPVALVPIVGLPTVIVGVGVLQVAAALAAALILGRQGGLRATPSINTKWADLLRRATLAMAPPARLEGAVRALRERPVTRGEVVISQGEAADLFYVVADGRFEVSQAASDGRSIVLRELGRGDGFGEIGLLRGSSRTATVTATADGRLLVLDREAFLELVGDGADLRTGLLARYTTPVTRTGDRA